MGNLAPDLLIFLCSCLFSCSYSRYGDLGETDGAFGGHFDDDDDESYDEDDSDEDSEEEEDGGEKKEEEGEQMEGKKEK